MSSLNQFSPVQTTTPLTETPMTADCINERQIHLKFVIVGDAKVGKTSILNKLIQNDFRDEYRATLGCESSKFEKISIFDKETHKNYFVTLELWDTSGKLLKSIKNINYVKNTKNELKSCKHPKTNLHQTTSTTKNSDFYHNELNEEDENENELDLESFFDEIDFKEAMESFSDERKEQNGYSSSSTSENPMFERLDALILCFDVTNISSLSNLNAWLQLFCHSNIDSENVPILVIGNKADLNGERCIKSKEGRIFCQQLINPHIFKEISCKDESNEELKQIFIDLARKCITKEASILHLMSSDIDSANSENTNYHKPTYKKRSSRNNSHSVKTCATNLCAKNKEYSDDPPFCVVL